MRAGAAADQLQQLKRGHGSAPYAARHCVTVIMYRMGGFGAFRGRYVSARVHTHADECRSRRASCGRYGLVRALLYFNNSSGISKAP